MKNTVVKTFTKSGTFTVPAGVKQVRLVAKYSAGKTVGGTSDSGRGSLQIDDYGNLYAWGTGSAGQLGNNTILAVSSPILVGAGLGRFREAHGGGRYNTSRYALNENGHLYTWGYNPDGGLGVGDVVSRSTPTLTSGMRKFTRLFVSMGSAFALDTNGDLYAIGGGNLVGQLGTGDTTARSSPTLVVGGKRFVKVQAGMGQEISFDTQQYVIGLTEDGDLYGWGQNSYGMLGVGDLVARSSPTLVVGGRKWVDFGVVPYQTYPIKGGAVIALTEAGDLYSWGINNSCVLGIGVPSSPLFYASSPMLVVGGRKWKSLHTNPTCGTVFAIDENDDAYSWGDNYSGQLGLGVNRSTHAEVSSPMLVVGGLKWKTIGSPGEFQALGITTAGNLYSWGSGSSFLIGDGTSVPKSSPVLIGSGGNWVKFVKDLYVYQGIFNIFAAKENGELYAWGTNIDGGLGTGDATTVSRSTPTLVRAIIPYKRTPDYRERVADVTPGEVIAIQLYSSPAKFGTHLLPLGPVEELRVIYES